MTGVESITEVMKNQRLRSYGHVERVSEDKIAIMARKVLFVERRLAD